MPWLSLRKNFHLSNGLLFYTMNRFIIIWIILFSLTMKCLTQTDSILLQYRSQKNESEQNGNDDNHTNEIESNETNKTTTGSMISITTSEGPIQTSSFMATTPSQVVTRDPMVSTTLQDGTNDSDITNASEVSTTKSIATITNSDTLSITSTLVTSQINISANDSTIQKTTTLLTSESTIATTMTRTSTTTTTATTTEATLENLMAPNYKFKVKAYSKNDWLSASVFVLVGVIVAIFTAIVHCCINNRKKMRIGISSRYMTDKKCKTKKT